MGICNLLLSVPDDDQEITVCNGCNEETREISIGDEGLTYCDHCEHIVEGDTRTISIKEKNYEV